MPEFLGAVSLVIAIAAYAVYLRDTFRKGVRPHVLTWLAFCVFTGVGFVVQIKKGAGPGAWTLGMTAASCLVIAAASAWKQRQEYSDWKKFPWEDWIWIGAAAIVFVLYKSFPDLPIVAAISATIADLLAYVPTIRQGWRNPYLECRTAYFLNSVKFVPTLWVLALLHVVSISTALYPAAVLVMNLIMVGLFTYRRSVVKIAEGARKDKAYVLESSWPM
ncbi:MAG: hypothetical protein M1404_01255 [Acidobacteria bacterium]|nr:hypothetical protein [Acidobacteriota bacterium]